MASKIMSNHVSMLESDIPKSCMGRECQCITINQGSLRNLLQCITQMLQQTSMGQMNPQELRKEDRDLSILPLQLPSGLPLEVVQEFKACLSTPLSFIDCDKLLSIVNQSPIQLFLQIFDEYESKSALHQAVLKGSRTLIHELQEKLRTLSGGNDSKLVEQDFIQKIDESGLSAIDMVSLIANKEIISCFEQRFNFQSDFIGSSNPFSQSPTSEDEKRNLLEKASPLFEKPAPTSSDPGIGQLSIREWLLNNNVDFVYCLHDAAMNNFPFQKKALEFVKFVCKNGDSSFLEPLLNVRDSLGKSPLHVHDYEPSYHNRVPFFEPLFARLVAYFPNLDLNMRDFSGRTPLHWAAAQGFMDLVTFLASQKSTNLNATYGNILWENKKESANFNSGPVSRVTPLHLAVIHNHVEVVEALLKVPKERGLNVNALCKRDAGSFHETSGSKYLWNWTPFQLAAYMGHDRILKVFLKDSRLYNPGLKNGKENALEGHIMIPALHLASSQFHLTTVKALVDCRRMDILVKDKDKNTALHYAAMHARGQLQVHANLQDYVTVSHFASKPPKSRKPSDHDIITCIDILMQSGLDMEQRNKDGMTPTLHPSCPEKVQIWWLQKMAREAQENKNILIIASNAVSVTAALVATASFVGPLQPPLGILDDTNQTWLDGYSQVQHTSIQVFLFCDSLSFYLAIAAIVFAMLPSWPIPREGLAQEVRIARRCVQVAVLLLFGSIIFVVCAFSAASIAIVPDQRWRYKTIAVISTSLGVLICFLTLFLSFMRILTLISSKNHVVKKISSIATQILLWE